MMSSLLSDDPGGREPQGLKILIAYAEEAADLRVISRNHPIVQIQKRVR